MGARWDTGGSGVRVVSEGRGPDCLCREKDKARLLSHRKLSNRSDCRDTSTGWYIDDIKVRIKAPTFTGDFEDGWGDWGADRGIWQVGTPTGDGPGECFGGTKCVGTHLAGNYPGNGPSLLTSPAIVLPTVVTGEDLYLRFRNWFSYSTGDSGQVQVSAWDGVTKTWGAWENVGTEVVDTSRGKWLQWGEKLTDYAGKKIRLGFYHTASCQDACCRDISTGWYIDNLVIFKINFWTSDGAGKERGYSLQATL